MGKNSLFILFVHSFVQCCGKSASMKKESGCFPGLHQSKNQFHIIKVLNIKSKNKILGKQYIKSFDFWVEMYLLRHEAQFERQGIDKFN